MTMWPRWRTRSFFIENITKKPMATSHSEYCEIWKAISWAVIVEPMLAPMMMPID